MRVKKLITNWHQNGCVVESQGAGEDYDFYEVGRSKVVEILENEPKNGMQLHNFIIKYSDGKVVKAFNPNHVEYFKTGN